MGSQQDDRAPLVGPLVLGKLVGSTDKRYFPFSATAGSPVIATEAYVDSKIVSPQAATGKSVSVYKTYAGEGYDDTTLPDVLIVDGSMNNDITATMMLTASDWRLLYFVNLSPKFDIHLFYSNQTAQKVGGPMSTSVIVVNSTGFQVLFNAPAFVPTAV
jgi:hypothetical protein